MQLALKKTLPKNATFTQKLCSKIIKARLVSQYSHGGIVIQNKLYHSTAQSGLHVLPESFWDPKKWDLFDMGNAKDELALGRFKRCAGAAYDWFSLLAFVGFNVFDKKRFYCFEWCYFAITGKKPVERITPETLLSIAYDEAVKPF